MKAFSDSNLFVHYFAHAHKDISFRSGKFSPYHYIMMEALPHGTLQDVTEQKKGTKTSAQEKLQLLHDMLAGVVEMHDKFVIHRDLKPENVMLTEKCTGDGK